MGSGQLQNTSIQVIIFSFQNQFKCYITLTFHKIYKDGQESTHTILGIYFLYTYLYVSLYMYVHSTLCIFNGQTHFHYLSRETEYKILDTVEAIQDHLDDHLLKTQIMRGSPYFKAFESMY